MRAAADLGEYSGDAPESKELSWRDDPDSSLSDYILKILEDGSATATYHVHRCQLAAGRNPCDYFCKLFSGGGARFSEGNDGVSQIELTASAAAAFPRFLDVVYGASLDAMTASAAALLHLANYFGNKVLNEAIVAFMQKDLTLAASPSYPAEAESFKLEKVAAVALNMCAENCSAINAETLSELKPALFARVVQSDTFNCNSAALSLRVASVCRAHTDNVDDAFLNAVACANRMPFTHTSAALGLLKQALVHSEPATGEEGSLRKRCVELLPRTRSCYLLSVIQTSTWRSASALPRRCQWTRSTCRAT